MKRSRPYLLHIQSALNDAHLNLTEAVAQRGGWRDDELGLLDRIDSAILHCQNMRSGDIPIRITETT